MMMVGLFFFAIVVQVDERKVNNIEIEELTMLQEPKVKELDLSKDYNTRMLEIANEMERRALKDHE